MASDWEPDGVVKDVLLELFNIGVGRAARVLSELADAEVILTVPELNVISTEQFAAEARERWPAPATIVRQRFDGRIHGDALLIFPRNESLELVRVVTGAATSADEHELTDLEWDAMLEIGNIVLNACITSFADLLAEELESSMPDVVELSGRELFYEADAGAEVVVYLKIDFSVRDHGLTGNILFIIGAVAFDAFCGAADAFGKRFGVS